MTMIGFVQNVAMITFHGEKDVTNVMHEEKVVAELKGQTDGATETEVRTREII